LIVDCHNHIGYDPTYQRNRLQDELITEMDENNVEHAIIFPFTSNPDVINQNRIVLRAMEKQPERFIGFFTMNPKLPNKIDLMHEYQSKGFKGLILDLRFGARFGDRRIHELMECAFLLGLKVWIHSDQKDAPIGIGSLEMLLQKFSGLNFVLSSMFRESFYIANKFKNVYIDTAVFELSQDLTKQIFPIGAHRILMGSNTPTGLMHLEINKIKISPELTNYQKEIILGKNACFLFNSFL
jgi:predicted TIM-barrel fold metal-dependent hydrolase